MKKRVQGDFIELTLLICGLTGFIIGIVLAPILKMPPQAPQDSPSAIFTLTPVQTSVTPAPTATAPIVRSRLMERSSGADSVIPVHAALHIALRAAPMEISFEDRERLAWLLWVEARGMDDQYWNAALSIIDTVFERMSRKILSKGSVRSTLLWCAGDSCQFPAWTANLGCDGISLCPVDYPPEQLIVAREAVNLYALGWRGQCSGFIFYGSRLTDPRECEIVGANGQYIRFNTGKWTPQIGGRE